MQGQTNSRTLYESLVRRAERKYKRWLDVIMKRVKRTVASTKYYDELVAKLYELAASKNFRTLCREAARQTCTMLAVGQQNTWREAASISGQGRRIFQALQKELQTTQIGDRVQQIVEQNAQLIQTVPEKLATEFSRMAADNKYAGKRPDELLEIYKQKAPHLTDVEARRIARTETGKAATALVQARAEKLGLNLYIWRTAKDQRVRGSHTFMEGIICAWDDPPNPEVLSGSPRSYGNYHPSGIFNCRCYAEVVVNPSKINYPASAHYHGSVTVVKNPQELYALYGKTAAEYK